MSQGTFRPMFDYGERPGDQVSASFLERMQQELFAARQISVSYPLVSQTGSTGTQIAIDQSALTSAIIFAELIDFRDQSPTWTEYGWQRITPDADGAWIDGEIVGTIRAYVRIKAVQDGNTTTLHEKQSIAIIGATGGTFTITYSGQTTSALAYDCSAGDVETALEALSNLTSVTVTGSGTYAAPFVVEFMDDFANLSLMTTSYTSLTPSTASAPAYEINNQTVKPGTRVIMYKGFGGGADYRFVSPMLACPGTEITGYLAGRTNVLTLNSSGCLECIQTSTEACP